MRLRHTATLLCLAATLCGGARADEVRNMIEALRPAAPSATRNLLVRPLAPVAAAPDSAAPAIAPAASAAVAPTSAPPSLALAIQFEPNSAQVRPASGPVLGSLVAAMQSPELQGRRFLIEGHADARGAGGANERLSLARAQEVRLYLVALGVNPARLRAVGLGASQLLPGAADADNRRVRVVTVE